MSLRGRLTLALALVAALASGAGASGAHLATAGELAQSTDAFLGERVEEARRLVDGGRPGRRGPGGDPGGGPGRGPGGPFGRLDAATQVLDAGGAVVAAFGPVTLPVSESDAVLASGRGADRPRYRDAAVDGVPHRLVTAPLDGGGAVQVARDVSEEAAVLEGLRRRLALVGLLATAGAAALGWLVAGRVLRPVERLRDAAQHVARTQDLTTPIEAGGDNELGSLARSFNRMLAALRTSREQQHRLVVDASHELRTPLTSLRTNVELLQRAPDLDPQERGRLVDDLAAEVRELGDLAAELVELAADRPGEVETPADVLLDRVATAAVERASRHWQRPIELEIARPGVVRGRAAALERAVANLVDNACKYSPPGVPVAVRVAGGRVEVVDGGPGIADVDLPRVFDRFHRADAARAQPGSGLGLAIVKDVVDRHGGRVWARRADGGGAAVGFELPVEVPEPARDDPARDDPARDDPALGISSGAGPTAGSA